MKKLFNAGFLTLVLAFGALSGTLLPHSASAVSVFDVCEDNPGAAVCAAKDSDDSAESMVGTVINLLIYAIGIVSVIMIIVGGLRYTLSGGDQAGVTSAKNTILYAVVGLVVAILSFAIVNFVLDRI